MGGCSLNTGVEVVLASVGGGHWFPPFLPCKAMSWVVPGVVTLVTLLGGEIS